MTPLGPLNSLYGLNIHPSEHRPKKWIFPKDRFVEYEPKDEWWCRKYGFGHESTDPMDTVILVVHGDVFMHPTQIAELKRQTKNQPR
jgi:hypothetical protein